MADSSKHQCPLCLECFCDPRILPNCTHSFCKNCIDRYIDCNRFTDSFPCPRCRADTTITANRANDFKKNTDLAQACQFSVCGVDACHQQADGFCRACAAPICAQCENNFHHRLPLPHYRIPLNIAINPNKRKLYCEKSGHEGQERLWVDESKEDRLLCIMCEQKLPVKNKIEVPAKAQQLREQLKSEVESCSQRIENAKTCIYEIEKNTQVVTDELDCLGELVRNSYNNLVAAAKQEMRQHLSLLHNTKASNQAKANDAKIQISRRIATTEDLLKKINKEVAETEDIDIVLVNKAKFIDLKQQQSDLSDEINKQQKVNLTTVTLKNFVPGILIASSKTKTIEMVPGSRWSRLYQSMFPMKHSSKH